jgi:ABC-type bacteriocin/lantibiotic exporter with double-glycine peptidase domain
VGLALLVHRYSLPTSSPLTTSPQEEEVAQKIQRFWEGDTPEERLFYLEEAEGRDGPACVQMVLAYWRHYVDQHDLKVDMRTKDNGTAPEFMDDPFKDRGFTIESGGRINEFGEAASRLRERIDRNRPVIISVKEGENQPYFVVVIGYYDEGVIVNDPTNEEGEHVRWGYGELRRLWSHDRYWLLVAYN